MFRLDAKCHIQSATTDSNKKAGVEIKHVHSLNIKQQIIQYPSYAIQYKLDFTLTHPSYIYNEHLQLRHQTAGALPVPITYRNEAELPSTLHISATLPESLPLSPPQSSAEQSSAEPFMMLRECTQCQKETDEDNGKMDENDGDWYCNDCWRFYE